MKNDYGSFAARFGQEVGKYGFTQIPNIAIRNCYKLGMKPLDQLIIFYFLSYPEGSFHAASSIANALGIHINTARTALYRMQRLGLISPVRKLGEANKYTLDGWVNKIKEYAIIGQSPTQELNTPGNQNSGNPIPQNIGNNKHNTNKKETDGYAHYKAAKEKFLKKRPL